MERIVPLNFEDDQQLNRQVQELADVINRLIEKVEALEKEANEQ